MITLLSLIMHITFSTSLAPCLVCCYCCIYLLVIRYTYTFPAGIVTTWSVLSSTILCLIHHPEYQDMAYKQICDVIGETREPTHSHKQNCPLIEAIELEVHRMIPVVPILQRNLTSELCYKGFRLPNNTVVNI